MTGALEVEDTYPPRPRAVRDITGTSRGWTVRARAIADPLPDSDVKYGPFVGQGLVEITTSGGYVVARATFGPELDGLIDLLGEIRDAAQAP